MNREHGHADAREARHGRTSRRNRRATRPNLEGLEGRWLLTRAYPFPTVPPNVRNVVFDRTLFNVRIDGPGVLRVRPSGLGAYDLDLFGTTQDSVVTVSRVRSGPHAPFSTLPLDEIDVKTGRLGAIRGGGTVDLVGSITPLVGGVGEITLNAMGPDARIEVLGDAGRLAIGSVNLGPAGRVRVAGNLHQMSVGGLNLDGGMFLVDQGILGEAAIGDLRAVSGGRLAVGRDVAGLRIDGGALVGSGGTLAVGEDLGALSVARDLAIAPGGRVEIGGEVVSDLGVAGSLGIVGGTLTIGSDLASLNVGRDVRVAQGGIVTIGRDLRGSAVLGDQFIIDAGLFAVGRDLVGTLDVDDDLALFNDAIFAVGRDVRTPIVVGDDLIVSASKLLVGRNLAGLDVEGNIEVRDGGMIAVGGDMLSLQVVGAFIGKGVWGSPDLAVGLNLTDVTVLGFVPGRGGIVDADIAVGKSLVGLDIRHGVFNSLITADVLIDGGSTPVPGGNIGPDGPIAVLNSNIRAGVQIRNLIINGDVVSTRPSDPTANPTRIVAGQNRAGVFSPGGNIENFQITGALIDAVIAASVAPEGGDGNLAQSCSDMPGDGTYDAPAGVIPFGTYGNPTFIPHDSPASYDEFYRLTGYVYNTVLDPTIDDCVLPGAINTGFAPVVPSPDDVTPTTPIPLASKSTVLGGVIMTRPHDGTFDFPGLFAADTRGVFIGRLPGGSGE